MAKNTKKQSLVERLDRTAQALKRTPEESGVDVCHIKAVDDAKSAIDDAITALVRSLVYLEHPEVEALKLCVPPVVLSSQIRGLLKELGHEV